MFVDAVAAPPTAGAERYRPGRRRNPRARPTARRCRARAGRSRSPARAARWAAEPHSPVPASRDVVSQRSQLALQPLAPGLCGDPRPRERGADGVDVAPAPHAFALPREAVRAPSRSASGVRDVTARIGCANDAAEQLRAHIPRTARGRRPPWFPNTGLPGSSTRAPSSGTSPCSRPARPRSRSTCWSAPICPGGPAEQQVGQLDRVAVRANRRLGVGAVAVRAVDPGAVEQVRGDAPVRRRASRSSAGRGVAGHRARAGRRSGGPGCPPRSPTRARRA